MWAGKDKRGVILPQQPQQAERLIKALVDREQACTPELCFFKLILSGHVYHVIMWVHTFLSNQCFKISFLKEKETILICWFIPQMLQWPGQGWGQSQELGI